MILMRIGLLLLLSILFSSCYTIEDGSRADVLRSKKATNDGGDETPVWDKRICIGDPFQDEFLAAESGDECSFSGGGCMTPYENEPKDTLLFREVWCGDSVIIASNVMGIDEEDPRPNAVWSDCSALDDGRTDEACEGEFQCFRDGANGCLERVACVGDYSEWDTKQRLSRYLLCDDIGPWDATSDAIYTDCANAIDARPLDSCDGSFLCARPLFLSPEIESDLANDPNMTVETVPACDGQNGYCTTNPVQGSLLVWCDGQTIHLLTSDSMNSRAFFDEYYGSSF